MDRTVSNAWWKVIFQMADELNKEAVAYSFDASTSLFVHGIEFDMDDVDIMIEWDYFSKVHNLFEEYKPCGIKEGVFSHFHFFIDGLKVHIMSSPSISDLKNDSERVKIEKDGHVMWSKCVQFYRRHITSDNPLEALIDDYLKEANESLGT